MANNVEFQMDAENNLDPQKDVKQLISNVVAQHWDANGSGILLSTLGQIVKSKHPTALIDVKLAQFLDQELAGIVKRISSPENPIVQVALPSSVLTDGDVARFFPTAANKAAKEEIPRYAHAFWAAFYKPLQSDHRRWLSISPTVAFRDTNTTEAPSGFPFEVQRQVIVDETTHPDPTTRSKVIVANIKPWLNGHGISVQEALETPAYRSSGLHDTKVRGSSLLDDLLATLSDADLKRIAMPLDIVAKLHRPR
jgi:hypothetical protein